MAGTTLSVLSQITSGDGLSLTSSGSSGIAKSADARRLNQAGKYYFEVQFTSATLGSNSGVGFCHSATAFSSSGSDMVLCYVNFVNGTIYLMGSSTGITLGSAYAQNDVVCVAVDLSNQRIWFRRNGGNWNNSGTADPATNTGGIAISTLGGFIVPVVQLSTSGNTAVANFGDSAFAQSVPSGFTSGWPTPGDATAAVNSFQAAEVWFTGPDSDARLSFVGLEVWATSSDVPAPSGTTGAAALMMGL